MKSSILKFGITISILLICSSIITQAQSEVNGPGSWGILVLKGKISPKISLLLEGHMRSTKFNLNTDYIESKTGIGYSFSKKLSGLIGVGIFNKYQIGGFIELPARQNELRSWLELNYKQSHGRFYFDHRGRLEQRFLADNYKNRVRYKLGMSIPLNKPKIEAGSFYLSVSDEIFFPLQKQLIEFNRFSTGMGCKINNRASISLSGVSDSFYKESGHRVANYIQAGLVCNLFDLTKEK
jgi:hypothetical protein